MLQQLASPAGTAESICARFSRPFGTIRLSLPNPGLRPGLSSRRAVQISEKASLFEQLVS
jgi:hypothetical protein